MHNIYPWNFVPDYDILLNDKALKCNDKSDDNANMKKDIVLVTQMQDTNLRALNHSLLHRGNAFKMLLLKQHSQQVHL